MVFENGVFHKSNEVSLNHARWLVTFIHDLRPFEGFINTIKQGLVIFKCNYDDFDSVV